MSIPSLEAEKGTGKGADSRRFRRASVMLKGALRIPGMGVEMINTKNISEGGIGLNTIGNCEVAIGSDVQLHLKGVVSSKDNTRLETYSMKVVYLDGSNLGLAFT
jgi:hypothetical protein